MIKNMATELNFSKMFLICLKFICLGFFAEIGKEALKGYLGQYYSNLNPTASAEQVQNFVTSQLGEYAYATGGIVKYAKGTDRDQQTMELK